MRLLAGLKALTNAAQRGVLVGGHVEDALEGRRPVRPASSRPSGDGCGGEPPPARQAQHEVEDLLARAPEPLVEELRRNLIDVVVRRRFWVYEIILRKRSSR